MWLLDAETTKLVHFMDDRQVAGKYAILSHTWDEEEVSFADIHTPTATSMKGFKKIQYTCQQALKDGFKYAWVDTCCINKDSSAELSEAINSMYRWYQNSAICYVYLADVSMPVDFDRLDSQSWVQVFKDCRWCTRGWTLQEMIAPAKLSFYDAIWTSMGLLQGAKGDDNPDKVIAQALHTITSVDFELLAGEWPLDRYPLAERLSWASRRRTTRIEDVAYSLLGLLDANMPLLYGEGGKAFLRLQEEILRSSMDRSILLWDPYLPDQIHTLIAPDIWCFRNQVVAWQFEAGATHRQESILTNRGLRTSVLLKACEKSDSDYVYGHFCLSATCYLLLRRDTQTRDITSTGLPVFEVIRAPVRPARNDELGCKYEAIKPVWVEVVLLRAPQSWIWSLDLGPNLSVFHNRGDNRLKPPRNCTEFIMDEPPELVDVFYGFNVEEFRKKDGQPYESATYKSYSFRGGSDVKQCRSPLDPQGVIRIKIWDPNDIALKPHGVVLPPRTHLLRVWQSNINATQQEIERESLPTKEGISRIWTIYASDVDPMNATEQEMWGEDERGYDIRLAPGESYLPSGKYAKPRRSQSKRC